MTLIKQHSSDKNVLNAKKIIFILRWQVKQWIILHNGMHDKLFHVQHVVKLASQYQDFNYTICTIWYGGTSLKKSLSEIKRNVTQCQLFLQLLRPEKRLYSFRD